MERHDENDFRRMARRMGMDAEAASCLRISEHLHAYVEAELEPIRTVLVREHLGGCESCRQVVEELKAERLWFLEAAVKSPALSDTFTRKVLKRIEKTAQVATRRRRHALFLRLGGAAAAALLMAAMAAGAFFYRGERAEKEAPTLALKQDIAPPLAVSPIVVVRAEKPEPPRAIESILPERIAETPRHGSLEETDVPPDTAAAFRRRTIDPNFGSVIGMALKLSPSERSAPDGPARDDPCRPDPNRDGKTDIIDVAYSCQVILVGQPPSSLEVPDSKPTELSDCDESCLRA